MVAGETLRNGKLILLAVILVARAVSAPAAPVDTESVAGALHPQVSSAEAWARDGDYQRSSEIFSYRSTARSGWQRGEEIYFYKCWVCHNQYAKAAPMLSDLFKRPMLANGNAVTDANVAEKILVGSPAMPGFRSNLDPPDLDDLLAYFRSGNCCYTGEEPPRNPRYHGVAARPTEAIRDRALVGGPAGSVRNAAGNNLEGIMVQLVSHRTGIRTTVYSDDKGRYEFPPLEDGDYVLRIARPLEYKAWQRDRVKIAGTVHFDDIVLERISALEVLPPTPEVISQLTPAEWLMNLPGSGEDKRIFVHSCNWCHSYQQAFRNRFDATGWQLMVDRMTLGYGSPLILTIPPEYRRETPEQREKLVHFLATARAPDSKLDMLQYLPRPMGAATQVVVTEYELPRVLLAAHDVCGDSKGNIWYTSHRSPYIGKLDPRTGLVTEYRLPTIPGVLPGTHAVWIDKNDNVWLSETWSANLTKFDPRTEKFTRVHLKSSIPPNAPAFGNFGLAPDGSVWYTMDSAVVKIDPATGWYVQRFPFRKILGTYDNIISDDGRYWAGGQWPGNLIGLVDTHSGKVWEIPTPTPQTDPSKGSFDRDGNAWFGGRGGSLVKLDTRTRQVTEYPAPTPYVSFYEAMVDRNNEVWAGEHQAGRFARFNPRTGRWIEYLMPEPFAHDRRTWIDNSTNPVTVWYVDHNGYIVRIQPRQ